MEENKSWSELKDDFPIYDKKRTLEELEEILTEVYNRHYKKERNIIMQTGRGGAAFRDKIIKQDSMEHFLDRKLNDEELKELDTYEKARYDELEDGAYEISNIGITYKGLYDGDMQDGYHLVKSNGKCYVEKWKNKYRVGYEVLTQERFDELKNKLDV